jgi:hypothetical protein
MLERMASARKGNEKDGGSRINQREKHERVVWRVFTACGFANEAMRGPAKPQAADETWSPFFPILLFSIPCSFLISIRISPDIDFPEPRGPMKGL